MRCVILSACPVSPELKRLLRPDDFIIACDAGYRNCAPLGCKPNIILGDFDTAPCPVQQNDDIIVLPHVKDDTDTEYAAKLASEKGFTEVLLLGALGGRRIEHTLSNLATGLGLEERGVRVTLQDERSRITFVRSGETRAYPKEEFSISPLSQWRAGRRACVSTVPTMNSPMMCWWPVIRWESAMSMPKAQTASPSPPARGRWWSWKQCRIHRS